MAQNAQEDEDLRAFDHSDSDLPPLPSDDDESFIGVHPPSDDPPPSEGSAMIEREMKRKLLDIESSFLPDLAEASSTAEAPTDADDTYLYGRAHGNAGRQPRRDNRAQAREHAEDDFNGESTHAEDVTLPQSPPTPDDAYKTPAPDRMTYDEQHSDDDFHEGDTSFEEPAPSSPAAAAAQRTNARTGSNDKPAEPAIEVTKEDGSDGQKDDQTQSPQRPKSSSTRPTSSASTIKGGLTAPDLSRARTEERRGLTVNNSISSRASDMLSTSSRASSFMRKRPSFMRSGNVSQRSSTSSFAARSEYSSDGENNHLGADYALQSGGAAPSSSNRPSLGDLSRLPSLGSVASSVSGQSEERSSFERAGSTTSGISQLSGFASHRGLGRLDEEPRPRSISPPTTPRPYSSDTQGPVDTVIANHVRNIRVPDTVAKEYREKHGERSPDKKAASTSAFAYSSRTKHNLTLKEQNSKIDKLSKENFDLKLKIHFLDQALQNRSDEGVKEMISKNVQLQTDLATEKKDNQSLRRKVRDLERKLKAQEEGLAAAKATSSGSEDEKSNRSTSQAEMEEEITYLRECLQHSEIEIEKLREENLAKEVEKRRMAEYVKSMGERRNSEPTAGVEEAMEMWKDLLEAETARREQADEDAQRLREEIRRLKSETASQVTNNNNRNTYNISRQSRMSYARSQSGSDGTNDIRPGTTTTNSSATLVDQLKHENAELRRDLGAQTSMLVSRNRERERLQQEIEELKLSQRRGDSGRSVAGDSIFERSISRANNRPSSRMSAAPRSAAEMTDAERDEYEAKQAQLRDEVASTKMINQDLERELNAQLDLLERTEEENRALKEERDLNLEDLQALQQERDEALRALEDKENECEDLREEAIQTIERLEQEIEQKEQELDRIINELENRNEDFEALQQEMKNVSESLIMLEDDRNASQRKIQQLEQELEDANQELEALDQALNETRQKIERFEVQGESNQSEISFLREEQEGDKIKIGDLEAALSQAQINIQDEKDRLKELEERVTEERRQREALDSQEKEQVQKAFDELNTQASKAKEEVRRLRKSLSSKEVEATTWKERLDDLESNLRDALGSLDGTKSTILKDVSKLQKDLDATVQELDHARTELADKDRMLRNRDALLESTGLESRKLADMLDKERQARLQDKHRYEQAQRTHQTTTRTVQSFETRVLELETTRSQDRRRIAQLEAQYRDQLLERNNLLLALWNRLSTICGADWAQNNSLVNGELPSLEIIGRYLPGFSKNILNAIKTVEGIIGSFKSRIRSIEKELWKDYQNLEHTLDVRIKRLDAIEKHVRNGVGVGIPRNDSAEMSRLKNENKFLKNELQLSRQSTITSSHRSSSDSYQHRPSPTNDAASVRSTNKRNSIASSLLRHHSSSSVELLHRQQSTSSSTQQSNNNHNHHLQQQQQQQQQSQPAQQQPSEQRWIHRLKELERRLKAEREARLLDRSGARKRLEEGRAENEELKMMLERERDRHGGSEFGDGPEAAEYPTVSTR